MSLRRTPYAILDDGRRIVGMLAGRPLPQGQGPDTWDDDVAAATAAIQTARESLRCADDDPLHRRGEFLSGTFGVSHGGGQMVRLAAL